MWLYNLGISLYAGGIRLAALWHGKARLWSEGRRNIFERMEAAVRPSDRIVWVHAASLGEFEQARPIIERLRAEHPEYKILLTFFSPSGYEIRKNYEGADYVFYLPADTPLQRPPFSGHRPPRDRHFHQIRILDQPALRTAAPQGAVVYRFGDFPPQFGLLPSLRRHVAAGVGDLRHAVRAERRIETAALRDRVRQRGRRGRYALRPCGSDRRSGAAGGDDRTLSWRRSSFSWPDRRGGPTRRFFCRS